VDKYILFISCLLLIVILTGIAWFILIKISKDRESEFVISYRVLLDVLDIYKETILVNKINKIIPNYDLNEKSPTNSRQAFEVAKNEIISLSVKEIMKVHLSRKCLKSLLEHYSVDGLSLLIITHLKR